MKKVLIVVDMQNDFITGSLGSKEAELIVPKVINKIKQYQAEENEIIFTRDTHYKEYLNTQEGAFLPVEHCMWGSNGHMVHSNIDTLGKNCVYVNKESFGWRNWEDTLSRYNFEEIELIGLCTDICVVTNALLLKTLYPEIKITVDASCCAGVTPESHNAALLTMKMCQVNVINE